MDNTSERERDVIKNDEKTFWKKRGIFFPNFFRSKKHLQNPFATLLLCCSVVIVVVARF